MKEENVRLKDWIKEKRDLSDFVSRSVTTRPAVIWVFDFASNKWIDHFYSPSGFVLADYVSALYPRNIIVKGLNDYGQEQVDVFDDYKTPAKICFTRIEES